MQSIRSIISGGDSSALIQREVLTLTDKERQSLLDEAGISSSREIGAAEVLAIKAGLAMAWNKLRLLRRYSFAIQNSAGGITHCLFQVAEIIRDSSCWGGEDATHFNVGNNLKGEIAPFSFPLPSGGE